MKKLKTDNVSNKIIFPDVTEKLLKEKDELGGAIRLVNKNIHYVINALSGEVINEEIQQELLDDLVECCDILAYEYIDKF